MSSLEREVGGAKGEEPGSESVFGVVECIHMPYCQVLVRYPSLESLLLKHKLHNIDMVRGRGRG